MKSYHDIAHDGGSDVAGQVAAQAERLAARLGSVRHVVAVMSGKGGVGKSVVTVNLGAALALAGWRVGLVDGDVNGPSLARMTGVQGAAVRTSTAGAVPPEAALGLQVMSMDLFLPDARAPVVWDAPTQHDAYAWRGLMEARALREFLADTAWGELDALLVDLPPGADRLPTLVDLVPRLAGTIVVTIPSGVAQFVVGKSIEMAQVVLRTPVLGLIENMAAYVCPHCGREDALFPAEAAEALADEHGVPFLGRVPFDPHLATAADAGQPYLRQHSDRPAGQAFRRIAAQVRATLEAASPVGTDSPPEPTRRGVS